MPSPSSYGCCTRVNFVLKKHLLFQMNLSNSGLKNRSIKEYWLIFTVLKFSLGLQFLHNLTKFKIIKYISTIYRIYPKYSDTLNVRTPSFFLKRHLFYVPYISGQVPYRVFLLSINVRTPKTCPLFLIKLQFFTT